MNHETKDNIYRVKSNCKNEARDRVMKHLDETESPETNELRTLQ